MPYGIPASKGGESPENTAKMERCVQELMGKGYSKDEAIPICKVRFGFTTKRRRRRAR